MKKKQLVSTINDKEGFKMLSGVVARAECGADYHLFIDYKNQQQVNWTEKTYRDTNYGDYYRLNNVEGTTGWFRCRNRKLFEELTGQVITDGANVQIGQSLIGGKFDEDARKVFDTNLREMEYAYTRDTMLEDGTTI